MKKRYLFYLKKKDEGYEPKKAKDILQKLRNLVEPHSNKEELRDIRISRYFIELDVGSDENAYFIGINEAFVSALSQVDSVLLIDEITEEKENRSIEETLYSAVFLFNMERFWKSHEVLEAIWRTASGSNKKFLNGFILVDAAYVHLQKGEDDIYFSILGRSIEKLSGAPEYLFNVNLKLLLENVEKILSEKRAFYFKIMIK
ncbi:conserved protein of unknown function [Candidatus Nitrosocosmicus franklandus]|uniref:DUF309 domain-containing protein n=1 Tax=Candidatus Nitrosocosmicus franklandianus TaxID=1798806 RepID=A0A484I8D8_9ARCH|nr:conserved protein of unknown function [Candidatus Nitrosocosmicus franklandus]